MARIIIIKLLTRLMIRLKVTLVIQPIGLRVETDVNYKSRLIYQAAFVFGGIMAKGRTSITERLKKSQKRETRRDMAHDWADKWEQDYLSLLSQIKQAISKGHDDDLIDLFADLRALQQPKFEALHRVIDELITPTRELIDD